MCEGQQLKLVPPIQFEVEGLTSCGSCSHSSDHNLCKWSLVCGAHYKKKKNSGLCRYACMHCLIVR